MKLTEIYEKSIDRSINPAVVAQDKDAKTVEIEITEYVFTDEIINNLYKVLIAIKNKDSISKTGIWINGYYGSGKSHFLKYVHYCIAPSTHQEAMERLVQAVKERDFMKVPTSKIRITNAEIAELKRWYDQAEIEDILFNAQDVSKANRDNTTFTNIFFNMFNECRGFNAYNIPLAILFEKYLAEKGEFEPFKIRLKEQEGFDWSTDAADVVSNELDTVLRVAKECVPALDTEALKVTLLNKETYHIDTRKLAIEIKDYINTKGPNYRLLFLVDEVSQFVNTNKEVLLDLQTIIERISLDCNRQVWIACTAQQTIESVASETGVSTADDAYGKIMGRFETRVSLESTDPAYITQKRILDKNSTGELALNKLYNENHDAILNQFAMGHELYKGFDKKEDFILSYPFIPYQFKLISKVFDAFQRLQYVVAEVKDNERSVLKITHETAKLTKENEIGYFVPFDAFFNQMFWQNLIHSGTKALMPGLELSFVKQDEFAQRVVKLLFMISNLLESDRQNFGSTLENMTLLMMSALDENKLQLRNKIESVLNKLIENSVVRIEKNNYYFYNEDEVELSKLINSTQPGVDFMADILRNILFTWLKVDNKFRFVVNDFKIIVNIDGKNYYGTNGDISVAFSVFDDNTPLLKSLSNSANTMIVCLNDWFMKDKELRMNFILFCKVEKYHQNNQVYATEMRQRSIDNFKTRNGDLMAQKILPVIHRKFSETPFVSGQTVIDASEINGDGAERYRNALTRHFESVYKYARLVETLPITQEELKQRANRKSTPNEYSELNVLSEAEKLVNDYISRMGNEILLSDMIDKFKAAPYGWKDTAIVYIVTELCKRKLRDVTYKNQPRFPITDFVNKAMINSERVSLGVTSAEEMSQKSINKAIAAWKTIFNEHIPPTGDGNALFDDLIKNRIYTKYLEWRKCKQENASYPFATHLSELTDKLTDWLEVRDPKRLFEIMEEEAPVMATLVDTCKNIIDFIIHNLPDYNDIKRYCEQNDENFHQLGDEERRKADLLKAFFKADNPVDEFRGMIKSHKELKTALQTTLKELKAQSVQRYESIFEELYQLAKENKVEPTRFADKEYKLQQINRISSVGLFRLELSRADRFLGDERAKILLEANRVEQERIQREQEQKRREEIANGKTPPPIKPVVVAEPPVSYALPRAKKILTTEKDVEDYLADIRKNLIDMIKKNQTILIK
jgi:hypothetical protein